MKLFVRVAGAGALLLMLGLFIPGTGRAEVNVSISVPLPGLVLPVPPGLIVVPGTYVYYPPDVDADIFFYHGYWYRPYRGGWYISSGYNGPWRGIGPRRVPRALFNMPRNYRSMPSRYERVPYGTVQRNWRSWENERHWDRDDRGPRGGRDERGGWGEGRGGGHGRGHGRGRD